MNCLSGKQPGEHTLVLGIGNPLCGDDGAGIEAVEMLSRKTLPQGVRVMEAGLPGWELQSWLEGWLCVILIDAVDMDKPAGSCQVFQLNDTKSKGDGSENVKFKLQTEAISLHQPDLASGLALAEALNLLPQTLYLYGIQPADTELGKPLSPEVRTNLPELVDKIIEDLGKGIYEPKKNIAC